MKNTKVETKTEVKRPFGVELLEALSDEETARLSGGTRHHKYHTMMASYPSPDGKHLVGDF